MAFLHLLYHNKYFIDRLRNNTGKENPHSPQTEQEYYKAYDEGRYSAGRNNRVNIRHAHSDYNRPFFVIAGKNRIKFHRNIIIGV